MFNPVPEWLLVYSAPGKALGHLMWNLCNSILHWNTKIFYSSFSLGPGNRVHVVTSHVSSMPPRSVPVMHISEMVLYVLLTATILCASMNSSIYFALFWSFGISGRGHRIEAHVQTNLAKIYTIGFLTLSHLALRDSSSEQTPLCLQQSSFSKETRTHVCQIQLAAQGWQRPSGALLNLSLTSASVKKDESEFCSFIEAGAAGTDGCCEGQGVFHTAFYSTDFV